MKNLVTVVLLLALCGLPAVAQEQAQAFANQKDKTSYAIGADIGNSFKRQGFDLNPELVLRGLRDALGTGSTLLTDKEIRDTIMAFRTELQAKMQETMKAQGEKNQKEGTAFLAENKKKEGVVTLPSGLQYKVITAGTGPKPTADDSVKCHYRGTFLDGKEFDSSYSRNEAAVFPVRGVIAGWTEAVQLMSVGSKWQLVIPYELAYGAGGNPPRIGPYATLVFEIELLGIEPPAAAAQPKPAAPPHH
jgi:FKBP-type peptidyl-prolyl cis-trans isomerase FklB